MLHRGALVALPLWEIFVAIAWQRRYFSNSIVAPLPYCRSDVPGHFIDLPTCRFHAYMTSYHFRANIKMIPFRFGQLRKDGWLHSKLYCIKAH